jgi:putative DNA primase/helicase
MTKSFLNKEDVHLQGDLIKELPGILRWAVEGWVRLRERGRFIESKAAAELREGLVGLTSPVKAFLDECCVVEPMNNVACRELYSAFRKWSRRNGHSYLPTAEMFGRDLAAVVPSVYRLQERRDGKRVWLYGGITLCP